MISWIPLVIRSHYRCYYNWWLIVKTCLLCVVSSLLNVTFPSSTLFPGILLLLLLLTATCYLLPVVTFPLPPRYLPQLAIRYFSSSSSPYYYYCSSNFTNNCYLAASHPFLLLWPILSLLHYFSLPWCQTSHTHARTHTYTHISVHAHTHIHKRSIQQTWCKSKSTSSSFPSNKIFHLINKLYLHTRTHTIL